MTAVPRGLLSMELDPVVLSREEVLEVAGYGPPEIHWQAPGTSRRKAGAEHTIQDACGRQVCSWKEPDEIRWRAPLHD